MIYIIGIGPGHPDYLLPAAVKAANQCQVLAGGKRALALFQGGSWEKFQVTGDLAELKEFLQGSRAKGLDIGVLVSGDPGFYSLLPFMRRNFPEEQLHVIPGISSLQMAFGKVVLSWQDAMLSSAHGRPVENICSDPGKLLGLLTGKDNTPQKIANYLLKSGRNRRVFLGDNLSCPEERWLETNLGDLARDEGAYLNAVLIVMPAEEG